MMESVLNTLNSVMSANSTFSHNVIFLVSFWMVFLFSSLKVPEESST